MAMYWMSGKTLLKQYIEEDPKKVLNTQFVIISSTIRNGGRYDEQVLNANNILFPKQDYIVDYDHYKTNENYHKEYTEQIHENRPFLATLIKYVIEEGLTVVFLCGEKEKKYYYLKLIQKYIMDEFNFPMYDYKKYKEGEEKVKEYDATAIIQKCDKILKKASKDKKKKMMSSEKGREKLINSMSKKELKKELKKRDLYMDNMSKSEMIDMLDTFI